MERMGFMDAVNSTSRIKPIQDDSQFSNKADVPKQAQRHYDEVEELLAQEDLEEAVKIANQHVVEVNTQLEYRIHEGTERIMVQLVDRETNDVLKELPPEKMLDLVENIWKNVGIIIDKHK